MKRVNIPIKDEIHVKAKIISAITNTTLSDYLQKAIEDAIEKDKEIIKGINEYAESMSLK